MSMTHDERISSYIDNELSAEQEQEFLISLAASDGLRKSFRSDLMLKKVLHHDEAATNPPRKLRAAVFTTLGLGGGLGASALSASKANAASSTVTRSLVRSLFATKMSTLVTVVGISASALAGYGVRSLTSPTPMLAPRIVRVMHPAMRVSPQPVVTSSNVVIPAPVTERPSSDIHRVSHPGFATMRPRHSAMVASKKEPVAQGAAGGGLIQMGKPTINGH